jgi:hypothetical protein
VNGVKRPDQRQQAPSRVICDVGEQERQENGADCVDHDADGAAGWRAVGETDRGLERISQLRQRAQGERQMIAERCERLAGRIAERHEVVIEAIGAVEDAHPDG